MQRRKEGLWQRFIRSQGENPDDLHAAIREILSMVERLWRRGVWGPKQRTPLESIPINPRLLAKRSKARKTKRDKEGRQTWPAHCERTFYTALSEIIRRGWLIPADGDRRRRNQCRCYVPAWLPHAQTLQTDCRRIADGLQTELQTESERIGIEENGLSPVETRTGSVLPLNSLTPRLQKKPEEQPLYQPIPEDRLSSQKEIRLAELLGMLQAAYPDYSRTLQGRIETHVRNGTPREVLCHAIRRALKTRKRPTQLIGYIERVIKLETANHLERQANQESEGHKRGIPSEEAAPLIGSISDACKLPEPRGGDEKKWNPQRARAREEAPVIADPMKRPPSPTENTGENKGTLPAANRGENSKRSPAASSQESSQTPPASNGPSRENPAGESTGVSTDAEWVRKALDSIGESERERAERTERWKTETRILQGDALRLSEGSPDRWAELLLVRDSRDPDALRLLVERWKQEDGGVGRNDIRPPVKAQITPETSQEALCAAA